MERFFAIVNPAAGGGRSAKLAGPALERLRKGGLEVDEVTTGAPGDAVHLARDAYARGYRRFLAVGGDGTGHEILNGIFGRMTIAHRTGRRASRGGTTCGGGKCSGRPRGHGLSSSGHRQFFSARLHP